MTFLAPELMQDHTLAEQFVRYERQSASPGMAKAMIGWLYGIDVRHVLSTIRVPTLLLHHADATRIAPVHGRYIAQRIAGDAFDRAAGLGELHLGR